MKNKLIQKIIKSYLKNTFDIDIKSVYINKMSNGYDIHCTITPPKSVEYINVDIKVDDELNTSGTSSTA